MRWSRSPGFGDSKNAWRCFVDDFEFMEVRLGMREKKEGGVCRSVGQNESGSRGKGVFCCLSYLLPGIE